MLISFAGKKNVCYKKTMLDKPLHFFSKKNYFSDQWQSTGSWLV
jgi:hypothetical protein